MFWLAMKCWLHLKSSDKVYFNFKKYTSIAIVQFVQPLDIHSSSRKSINIFIFGGSLESP